MKRGHCPMPSPSGDDPSSAMPETSTPSTFSILVIGKSLFFTRHFAQAEVRIGRALDNDLVLPDLSVSRRHCSICIYQQTLFLFDRGSLNGCSINGCAVGGFAALYPKDEILIGTYALYLQLGRADLRAHAGKAERRRNDSHDFIPYDHASRCTRSPTFATERRPIDAYKLSRTPTSASLRRLIDRIFLSASDFDAFCLDHFPAIRTRFDVNMDRVSKMTLLLERAHHGEILHHLRIDHPDEFIAHSHLLCYEE